MKSMMMNLIDEFIWCLSPTLMAKFGDQSPFWKIVCFLSKSHDLKIMT